MKTMTERKVWIVLIAVLFLLAACKGETPTAPPSGGPPTTPPPTGVSIVLTSTNPDPLVSSSVTITATVTLNGSPVPDGTAVEFLSSGGFLDTTSRAIIKTTTGGVATVRLTSSIAGPIRVTATVNNVTRTVDVTFRAEPVTPIPPGTTPTILSVNPPVGKPSGGQVVRIIGTNFKPPVRVLFDVGGPVPVEAFVNSVNAAQTEIEVITPAINLGVGQQLEATVIVITQAGTTTEQRAELVAGFIFRNEELTPSIFTVTPNSGPVTGGTRVSILGEGFQQPVQVLFNTAEARVLNVKFDEVLVETPSGRDTNPDGSGTVTGPVVVTVRNVASNTSDSMADGFFYKAAMQITAVGPTEGIFTGGTRVTIDGIGFLPPVAVTIAGIGVPPVFVSGTKIIVLTPPVQIESCSDVSGPITVGNVNNGDTAAGPNFTFRVPPPFIINVAPPTVTVGVSPNVFVTVANAQPGVNRIKLGDRTVFPTAVSFDEVTGVAVFTVPLPTNFEFPIEECGNGGEQLVPLDVDVTYQNADTGCEDTATDALTVNPPSGSCILPPPPPIASVNPAGTPGSCADVGTIASAGATAGSANITFTNGVAAGGESLTISGATVSGTNGVFGITPTGAGPIAPGDSAIFTVSVDPDAAGPITGTVTFSTNDPNRATVTVCITGNGT